MVSAANANELAKIVILTEEDLAETEQAYLDAERSWGDAMRRCAAGIVGEDAVAAAQKAWLELGEKRRSTTARLEQLRRELYEQRRRELAAGSLADIITDHEAARRSARRKLQSTNGHSSIIRRLLGRDQLHD